MSEFNYILKDKEPSAPVTGLEIPTATMEKDGITYTLTARRIEIQLEGTQNIKVWYKVLKTFPNGEALPQNSSYVLTDQLGQIKVYVDDEGNELEGSEEETITEALMLTYWNASNAGREVFESTTSRLGEIAKNL